MRGLSRLAIEPRPDLKEAVEAAPDMIMGAGTEDPQEQAGS
jgi:hypothetical protein